MVVTSGLLNLSRAARGSVGSRSAELGLVGELGGETRGGGAREGLRGSEDAARELNGGQHGQVEERARGAGRTLLVMLHAHTRDASWGEREERGTRSLELPRPSLEGQLKLGKPEKRRNGTLSDVFPTGLDYKAN